MADNDDFEDGVYFDIESAKLIAETVHRVLGTLRNEMQSHENWNDSVTWLPFYNDTGETIPACSIVVPKSTGFSYDNGPLYKVAKPSTTFRTRYGVTCRYAIPDGSAGFFTCEGPASIAYDSSGTPAYDEGWGVKPGQWTLSKNYPMLSVVDGLEDTSQKILRGSFSGLLTRLLCKTTASISAASSSTSYTIESGTLGSTSSAGFTTVPSVYFYSAVASGKVFWAEQALSGWTANPLQC